MIQWLSVSSTPQLSERKMGWERKGHWRVRKRGYFTCWFFKNPFLKRKKINFWVFFFVLLHQSYLCHRLFMLLFANYGGTLVNRGFKLFLFSFSVWAMIVSLLWLCFWNWVWRQDAWLFYWKRFSPIKEFNGVLVILHNMICHISKCI